jgi:hypothetical protein
MGYWEAGSGVWSGVWGDEPADILDTAIDRIVAVYQRDWGRDPSENELYAGLKFCIVHTDRIALDVSGS